MAWMVQSPVAQTASQGNALDVFYRDQFALADIVRRAQDDALGAFGLDPKECIYDVIVSGAYWRLRDYAGCGASRSLLVVAAPIKRPYVWDATS